MRNVTRFCCDKQCTLGLGLKFIRGFIRGTWKKRFKAREKGDSRSSRDEGWIVAFHLTHTHAHLDSFSHGSPSPLRNSSRSPLTITSRRHEPPLCPCIRTSTMAPSFFEPYASPGTSMLRLKRSSRRQRQCSTRTYASTT